MNKFILSQTIFGKTKNMTLLARNYIRDLVDFQTNISKNQLKLLKYIHLLQKYIKNIFRLNKIPLLDPENHLKIIFDSILVSYNCFFLLLVSLLVCFNAEIGEYEHDFHIIANVAWITEMLL
jgi:hypothetical protein